MITYPKSVRFGFILLLVIPFLYCTPKLEEEKKPELAFTYDSESQSIHPQIKGVWQSIGNGYLIDASEDSILLYSYTRHFCYKEKNDYLEGLLNGQSQFVLQNDTLQVYLTDYGHKTAQLQARKDFVRIDTIPDDCMTFAEMQALDAGSLFNLYWEHFTENYAFPEERALNLDSIRQHYLELITADTDDQALFEYLGEIATLTRDQHTKVIAADGTTRQYRVTPSAQIVIDSFNNQTLEKDLNQFFNQFFTNNYRNISDSLLHGQGQKVANGQLEWGSLNDRVGYLHIHSFTGFAAGRVSRKQQIDSINHYMREIITAFQGKAAVIVDISFNFGGYDASGMTIAGYFTDQPVGAYTSQVRRDGSFYDEASIVIHPADSIRFNKPVYVLMTDISRSAAESFAMMMQALPNVQLVGTNTLGTLSGMLGKSVGDWYVTFSNQRLLTPDGKFYEVTGVMPDERIVVFPASNVFEGHKDAVRAVGEWF